MPGRRRLTSGCFGPFAGLEAVSNVVSAKRSKPAPFGLDCHAQSVRFSFRFVFLFKVLLWGDVRLVLFDIVGILILSQ
ncbi:hypothetical protein SAMN04487955_108118 [Halomonas korlensis]|uniref:Uncharacterized protein n=1 Tax=Halomonas korlensis TaxID=463301 RepID=A0A1I7IXI2_9GAMM|nr:hypothetical protein SAMN04487955_108118 [Halomonas korlensis]